MHVGKPREPSVSGILPDFFTGFLNQTINTIRRDGIDDEMFLGTFQACRVLHHQVGFVSKMLTPHGGEVGTHGLLVNAQTDAIQLVPKVDLRHDGGTQSRIIAQGKFEDRTTAANFIRTRPLGDHLTQDVIREEMQPAASISFIEHPRAESCGERPIFRAIRSLHFRDRVRMRVEPLCFAFPADSAARRDTEDIEMRFRLLTRPSEV